MTENNQTELQEEFIMSDLETLRVVVDSLRLQILGIMREPRTVKQAASELKIAPAKLYYHIGLLEEHGLIKVVSTRVVSGIIEKQYQITAKRIRTDPALLSFTDATTNEDGLEVYLNSFFDNAKAEIRQSRDSGLLDLMKTGPRTRRMISAKGTVCLTSTQAELFYKRVADLIKEIEEIEPEPEAEDKQNYGLVVMVYPTVMSNEGEERIEKREEQ